MKPYFLITALMALMATCNLKNNPDMLFEKYYAKFPDVLFADNRSATEMPADSSLRNLLLAYSSKDYGTAISGFDTKLKSNPNSVSVLFYRGVSKLEEGLYEGAIEDLSKVVNLNEEFAEEAMWYLSLAYLKKRSITDSILLLERLKNSGQFRLKAEELLHDLR